MDRLCHSFHFATYTDININYLNTDIVINVISTFKSHKIRDIHENYLDAIMILLQIEISILW